MRPDLGPRRSSFARGGIAAVGSVKEARDAAGEGAEYVDLGGRTVLPGLIDAHGHMAGLGSFGMGVLEFGATKSYEEVVAKVVTAAKKPGD
jgi:predicted amidohydrolase YtcJ